MLINKYFLNGIQMYPIKKNTSASLYYGLIGGSSSVILFSYKNMQNILKHL